MTTAARLWGLCQDVAGVWYTTEWPGADQQYWVARLLLGTAAQESLFRWRRQIGFDEDSQRGAFSLWQLEMASIAQGRACVRADRALRERVEACILRQGGEVPVWALTDTAEVLALLQQPEGDAAGCVLCRAHYWRVRAAIPRTIEGQAQYWKRHYNTEMGRGTAAEFVARWMRYCEPVIGVEVTL